MSSLSQTNGTDGDERMGLDLRSPSPLSYGWFTQKAYELMKANLCEFKDMNVDFASKQCNIIMTLQTQ